MVEGKRIGEKEVEREKPAVRDKTWAGQTAVAKLGPE